MRLNEIIIDVEVGDTQWGAWYTWKDGVTTWVDGTFVDGGVRTTGLDIGCLGDECCVPAEMHPLAVAAWDAGSVYSFIPFDRAPRALVVPETALSTQSISEALRRFEP
jgi:hypothetical protein